MSVEEPTQAILTRYRRDLHRIPETGFDLPKTIAYVRKVLASLDDSPAGRAGIVHILEPTTSCLCAFFEVNTSTSMAVRADMDALPVTELTGAHYASTHAGRMHACGHDGHMAMALGLASWLALHPECMRRNVLIVFEPAEETIGGARGIIESGVLRQCRVDRIVGFHVWPDLSYGKVAGRAGALLAASNETTIEVKGRASHIAKAEQGADALEACARILLASYDLIDELAYREPCLLKFGRMEAGQVRNQIAAMAHLEGSLRTFSLDMRERAKNALRGVVEKHASALGCSAAVTFSDGYPPVMNDATLWEAVRAAVPEVVELPEPLLISDDFAWFQQEVPGVFLLLGTGTGIPLHSDHFDFDEAILTVGLDVYKRLVTL